MTTPFPYRLNKNIRQLATRMVSLVKGPSEATGIDLDRERIEKILLVRANFRMGNSILAIPAISLFRRNFPRARIDFVGSRMSGILFQNLPIDRHFCITRRFPDASWAYLALLKQIRSVGYDLAVDVSCSHSAMGSFIVGFSAARFRAGLQGKRDLWSNVRIPKPREKNKYRILPAFLSALGLETQETLPSLILSPAEIEEGRTRIETLVGQGRGPIVGVFVGGRKARGKRWPMENFCQLVTALYRQGVNVVLFFGPEEKKLIGSFRRALKVDVRWVFEPSLRAFASALSICHLFVTCDSGPMHLACGVGVRTVAIFQNPDFNRWGPPPSLCRILYQPGGVSPNEVLEASLAELSHISTGTFGLRSGSLA